MPIDNAHTLPQRAMDCGSGLGGLHNLTILRVNFDNLIQTLQ